MFKQIDIILGLKCNEKCSFCFQDSNYIKKYDIKFDRYIIIKILISGKKLGYDMVNISGGEPTIYQDDFNFVLKLSKKLGYKTIKVITNGILFANKNFCEKNLQYITDIGLSFHSNDKNIQDNLTKLPGSYELVLQAVHNIKTYGIINLHNHCVINNENINDLKNHIVNIISLGFLTIHFMSLMHNTSTNKDKTYDFFYLSKILKNIIDKYKTFIKIELSYLQFCYMEGYEDYVLGFEYGKDYLSNNPEILKAWEKTMLESKEILQKCETCKYLNKCYGFWKK